MVTSTSDRFPRLIDRSARMDAKPRPRTSLELAGKNASLYRIGVNNQHRHGHYGT